jgi:uncharacterized protein (TIGR03437 family)
MLRLTATILTIVLLQITNSPEQAVNLNPTLSDDGRVLVFESSAVGGSFHAFRAELSGELPVLTDIGSTRIVSPGLSRDGKIVVFASAEDLVGSNADRNSEIYLFDGVKLKQLTQTRASTVESRLSDGNFQPSVTGDGRIVVFSSNREIFLYDTLDQSVRQLSNATAEHAAMNPKISADGSHVYYKRGGDLVLIELQTGATRVIASGVPELSLAEGRAVSNDGMRLVYSASIAANQTQVFMFDGRENSVRQLTQLGSRSVDVNLQPTISGDGKRVAFATRRRVVGSSDGGVELYLIDLPTGQVQQITNAPSSATAEVVSSLNFDGTLIAFNFPRISNNSEIYVASISPRADFGSATVLNAASGMAQIAPESIAILRGSALAFRTEAADSADFSDGAPPFDVAGSVVRVNGRSARIFYVSPEEVVFVVPDGLSSRAAEFVVTNAEGFSSKATANVSSGAPGVFTVGSDAVVLDADNLTAGPFDPATGRLRLSLFTTGAANAKNVSVTIAEKPVVVETVMPARLAGLDEIHVLVPAELAGAGASTLTVTADGVRSNEASLLISGNPVQQSAQIRVTQIYGGGGNSGAPFRNDFIEIFNSGTTPVSLAGWSVQYASATASTWSVTPLTAVTLQPGQYYLVQEASGGSNGVTLPAPDATGMIAMAAGSGKVALVRNSTALSGACPNDPNIVDLVGYGSTANCFRGTAPAPAASNTNAILRAANGCGTNFATGPPNPRNTSNAKVICTN